MAKRWTTSSFLTRDQARPNALIILNTPLVHHELFEQIWQAASIRLCADGGANRLYDRYVGRSERGAPQSATGGPDLSTADGHDWLPDLIKGDLDSLRPNVREYYESRGVEILHDPDQFSTDLGKCVSHVVALEQAEQSQALQHQLIICGGLSGRLDQTIHTLHALLQLEDTRPLTWAIGEESIACVLGNGKHDLFISRDEFGKTCGILPINQQAYVTTRGLEWDLGPTSYMYPTSIAAGVSTSNHLAADMVHVETDVPIVFTAEVKKAKHDR